MGHYLPKQKALRFRLTLLFFTCLTQFNCVGQSDLSLLATASKALKKADTTQAVAALEQFSNQNPTSGLLLILNQRLAEIYINRKQYDSALTKLQYAFRFKPKDSFTWSNIDSFDNLVTRYQFASAKADVCVLLSEVYRLQGNRTSSLRYLQLADSAFLPTYGGCANGMIMYRTFLSLKYADHYLQFGDTVKAVGRLFDYFMSGESFADKAAYKLRDILRQKYSRQQIAQEIERGISKARIIEGKHEEPDKIFSVTLFGHEIRRRAYTSLAEHQARLRKASNLQILQT